MKKEGTLLPPDFLLIFLVLSLILDFFFPIKSISGVYRLWGFLFVIIGVLINFWADSSFKKNITTVKPNETPTKFISEGPFSFSRHPMYLGFVLILWGVAMVLGSLSSFLGPLLMFITLERKFIPLEEKQMENTFRDKYLNYKKRVRRWI